MSASSRRAARPASGRSTVLRILVPALLVLVWIGVFGIGGMSFGRISDVATEDRAGFLPASAESTRVQDRISEFTGSEAIPAIIVAERSGGLTEDDLAALDALAASAPDLADGATASPVIPAEDGEAAQLVISIPGDADAGEVVALLEEEADGTLPADLDSWVSGPAGFTADLQAAFAGIDGILLLVALAVVLVILVVVYRSPVLPLLVLLSSMTALCAAILVNVSLAQAGLVTINGQVQGILFILVIGAATDYSLLYIARCRDQLREDVAPARAAWLPPR
ncbi:MMPL family transporter, partial [Brachybacterium phenoliresistens]|uniref:MMPL family transporter n=1 Tax=Brachybacterium phenoliresistens TaxID=396014 RepID=UPI0022B50269